MKSKKEVCCEKKCTRMFFVPAQRDHPAERYHLELQSFSDYWLWLPPPVDDRMTREYNRHGS